MGYYRLILAVAVLLSHTGLMVGPYDQGRSAVIGFFLLSGFVMTKLIDRYYANPLTTPLFYLDRLARIFPQYLFYAGVTLVGLAIGLLKTPWMSGCTTTMTVMNLTVLPMYLNATEPEHLCTLIPPAWSLGLELAFYLIIPVIVFARRLWGPLLLVAAAYSLSVYLPAYLGQIDTDHFAFRTLPGTLWIFLAGVSAASSGWVFRLYRYAAWVFAVALLGWLYLHPDLYALNSNKEVLAGVVLGLPLLELLRNIQPSRWDRLAGDISYGVFLNHFLLLTLVSTNFGGLDITIVRWSVIFISVGLSYATFRFIETPVIGLRRMVRKRVVAPEPQAPLAA